jgi:hypothetical protein
MAGTFRMLRSLISGSTPAATPPLQDGEPYVNFADGQFGVWNSANSTLLGIPDLLGVRMFTPDASYVLGELVGSQSVFGDNCTFITNTDFGPPGPFGAQFDSLAYALTNGGMRNKFRNQAMNIWQRGLGPFACAAGANTFTADGWIMNPTGALVNVQQAAAPAGFVSRNVMRLSVTGTNVSNARVIQRIPASLARSLGSNAPVKLFLKKNNTGSFSNSQAWLDVDIPTAPDNFTTMTKVINRQQSIIDDISQNVLGVTGGLHWNVQIPDDTSNGIQITMDFGDWFFFRAAGVLFLGDFGIKIAPYYRVNDPKSPLFDPPDPAQEWVECQRYFQTLSGLITSGYNTAGGPIYTSFPLPTTMRTAPSVVLGTVNYLNGSALGVNSVNATQLMTTFNATAAGMAYAGFSPTFSAEL